MRKWCYLLSAAALAVVLVVTIQGRTETHAISGCCKERSSYNGLWQKSNKNFIQCQEANKKDRDNVFQQQGLVWWDVNCE